MRMGLLAILTAAMAVTISVEAGSGNVGRGQLYYNGAIVRTLVPPSNLPHPGTDDFYAVVDGADGQLGVAAEAPGDPGYNGGAWAFHEVVWNVPPYLLTSEADVLDAEMLGDVTVTRITANDFRCPIQP